MLCQRHLPASEAFAGDRWVTKIAADLLSGLHVGDSTVGPAAGVVGRDDDTVAVA